MDKLTMAHEWAMKHGSDLTYLTVEEAWKYADAMQAEAEKREPKGFPEEIEEWQPDWSQAPFYATGWHMDESGDCYWLSGNRTRGYTEQEKAESFNYSGDWKNSLRERPNGK